MPNILEKKILKTIKYFDIFDYFLTDREIYQNLFQVDKHIKFQEVLGVLNILVKQKKIVYKYAVYSFPGKEKLVEASRRKDWIWKKKLVKAKRSVRILSKIPFLDAVFLCNQFFISTGEESDIDVLIVARKNRIWFVRFFSLLLMAIFRQRIQGDIVKDKICLSFFCTEDSLDFSSLMIEKDIYFAYWILHLYCLFDENNISLKLQKQNRQIFEEDFPFGIKNYGLKDRYFVKNNSFILFIKKILEFIFASKIGDLFQLFLKKWQLKKLKKKGIPFETEDASFVVSDSILKFHENDRRKLYRDIYEG